MKSLKFLSLVLMCATSSLALILPAIGVVSFPRQLTSGSGFHGHELPMGNQTNSDLQQNIFPPTNGHSAGGSASPILPSQFGTAGPLGQPVSASFPNYESLPPSLGNQDPMQNNRVHKMGMGLWLTLVSTWFLALLVWTIAPTPGSSKR